MDREDSPDLGVSHEPVRESYCETVSLERRVVVLSGNGIHVGGVGVFDSVSLDALVSSNTPSVVDAGREEEGDREECELAAGREKES